MLSQWECLLKNLGKWQGSFTLLSPQGQLIEDTPSLVSLEGLENNTEIRQKVERFPLNSSSQVQEYYYRSLNRSILFFENGAFSQGSIQWSPVSEFGAEFGLIESDRRLRLVQMYDKDSQLSFLTLIREKLAGSETEERPHLSLDQLLGTWTGEAITLYPDWRSPDSYSTHLTLQLIDDQQVKQQLTFGDKTLKSRAKIGNNLLYFEESALPIQIFLLPDGCSSNCPTVIKPRQGFVLELGWLLSPNQRQRLIRRYDDKGSWVSLTLVKETKIS